MCVDISTSFMFVDGDGDTAHDTRFVMHHALSTQLLIILDSRMFIDAKLTHLCVFSAAGVERSSGDAVWYSFICLHLLQTLH